MPLALKNGKGEKVILSSWIFSRELFPYLLCCMKRRVRESSFVVFIQLVRAYLISFLWNIIILCLNVIFLIIFCSILFIYSQFLIVITKYWRLQTLKYFFQCVILTIVLYVHSLCQRRVAEGCLTTTFPALNSYCVHMVRYCFLTISNCFDETKLHV